jgi:hypothetical protein
MDGCAGDARYYWERLIRQNAQLKEQVASLQRECEAYRKTGTGLLTGAELNLKGWEEEKEVTDEGEY